MKIFILVDFYAKMVKIADLEHSADANSGMRSKIFFPPYPSDDNKVCLLDQPPWNPQGGPKVPLRYYVEKNFVF